MKKLILSLLLCPTIYFGQIVEMVTGGTPVSVNEIPYQIALFQNGTFRCGGSILNEKWILTAAHCFDYPSNPNIVKVGISTLNQNNQTFEIKQKVIHPNYSIYNKDNDIALVEIKGNILYGTSVQPINLVSVNENLYNINTTTTVSGWGWLYPNSEASSNHLQKVEVPIISNTEASNRLDISFPMHPRVTQNMIATGAVSNHRKGACHGDSGGALTTIDANGQVKQIGVVSWGVPKCTGNENSPTIYTKVANYIDWIRQYVPLHIKIEGSSIICDNTTHTYTIDNNDDNSIQWQLSSDIEEVSRTANSITIKPKSGFNGLATLTASNGNSETTKKNLDW